LNAALLDQIPEPLRAKISEVFVKAQRLEIEVRLLKETLRLALIKKYGPSAERLSDGQLMLLESEPGVCAAEVEAEAALSEEIKASTPTPELAPVKKATAPIRKPLPSHLPRQERIIVCSEADCRCGQCGGETKVIGYETSEQLSVEPIRFFVEVTKREKRACARCEEMGVKIAPVPEKIVEKGILSNRLLVNVVVDKYSDHKPLYRQALAMKRDADVEVSQATLCSGVMHIGGLLAPICGAMRHDLLIGNYIQADETPTPVQTKETEGKNHQAYLWAYSRPHGPVVYDFRMGREREGPRNFLKNYGGDLQTDGYSAYGKIGGEGLKHFACWAHVRRKFHDAWKLDQKEKRVVAILEKIGALYDVEREAQETHLDAAQREVMRKETSQPILVDLKAMILKARAETLPKSTLGKACDYALTLWEKLERYAGAGKGHVEIDNNWAENAMRPIALGRKNWLHIGSEEAGPKIAAIMSVIETCKRLKINVREYLEDVLPRIANWPNQRIAELTPMAWQAGQSKRVQ
jgi:transposase